MKKKKKKKKKKKVKGRWSLGPLSVCMFTISYIYIFIVIALDESIFLDVLHLQMKNIMSRDLEATPMGGATSKPIQ